MNDNDEERRPEGATITVEAQEVEVDDVIYPPNGTPQFCVRSTRPAAASSLVYVEGKSVYGGKEKLAFQRDTLVKVWRRS